MADIIIAVIILAMTGAALGYIRKAKKSGAACIGCSSGGMCPHSHKGNSGCSCGCSQGGCQTK